MKFVVSCLFIVHLLSLSSCSFLRTHNKARSHLTNSSKQTDSNTQENSNSAVTTQQAVVTQPVKGEEIKLIDAFCFINHNGTVYDLNPLKNNYNDYKLNVLTGTLDFNICRNALNSCTGKTGMISYTENLPTSNNNCVELSGNATVTSSFTLIQQNNDTSQDVLRMTLPPGDLCNSDSKLYYQTTIDLTCNVNATEPVITSDPFNLNACTNKIYISTQAACPKYNVYALWNAVQSNKWVFGIIIIALGIFFCFFGEEFLKISQIIAGGAVVLIVILYLIFNYTQAQLYSWQFWLIIVLASAVGCLAGYFMSKIQWLPGFIFGGLLGFVLGFFIFNLALRYIQSNPAVVFWICISACVVVGCLIGYFYEEFIAILCTGIVGAYGIIRGISIMAGGFPDERQVYELGSKGEWDQMKALLTPVIFAYLAGFLVLSAAGLYIQFKYFYDGNKKKKDDKKDEKALNENLKENQEN